MLNNLSVFHDRGPRRSQEDRFITLPIHNGTFLAVLDGHGGSEVANYAASRLSSLAHEELPLFRAPDAYIQDALSRIVAKLHEEVDNKCGGPGSTLTAAYIIPDEFGKYKVHAAILGDSPLMLLDNENLITHTEHSVITCQDDVDFIQSTIDTHRDLGVEDPNLRAAQIASDYIWAGPGFSAAQGVALTRALGNPYHKNIILRKPEVQTHIVSQGTVLIIASDGIRPDVSEEDRRLFYRGFLDIVKEGGTAVDVAVKARLLTNTDNLTILSTILN